MNTAILIAKEHLLSENILDSHSQLSGPIKPYKENTSSSRNRMIS